MSVDVTELARGVTTRSAVSVARAISLVEDRRPAQEPKILSLLANLAKSPNVAACRRVGITGPPGVGKSSLVSALCRALRAQGHSVGVLAVDPSSPRSGGALLGDRARIVHDPDDGDVFIRSMASGGHLGGLARAAAAVDVLSAAYDWVLVETTGVGQSETDIEHVADTVLLVIQPASGDMLQFIKAGILEIPDVLAVNKADLGEVAARAGAELRAALEALGTARTPPVVHTSTLTGEGIDELVRVLAEHRDDIADLSARRIEKSAQWALRLFTHRYGELGVDDRGGPSALRAELSRLIASGASSLSAVAQLAPR